MADDTPELPAPDDFSGAERKLDEIAKIKGGRRNVGALRAMSANVSAEANPVGKAIAIPAANARLQQRKPEAAALAPSI